MIVSPAIDLGGSTDAANFTISTWFKDLHTTSTAGQGWRTLMRGAQANHHVIIQNNLVPCWSFPQHARSFRPTSSFDLSPAMRPQIGVI